MEPTFTSNCVETASSTDCTYIQVQPIIYLDPALVLVVGSVLLFLVANFLRHAFYR